jgi:hypothetical protein
LWICTTTQLSINKPRLLQRSRPIRTEAIRQRNKLQDLDVFEVVEDSCEGTFRTAYIMQLRNH